MHSLLLDTSDTIIESSVIEIGSNRNAISDNENKEGLNMISQYNIKKASPKSHARNVHNFILIKF